METLWQDFRYAVRMLMKKPGFTAVAVLSLSLGIGANTTIFTLVKAVFLQSVPIQDPARVVEVYSTSRARPARSYSFCRFPAQRGDYREKITCFPNRQ